MEKESKKELEQVGDQQERVIEVPVFLSQNDINKLVYLNHLMLQQINTKLDEIINLAKQ